MDLGCYNTYMVVDLEAIAHNLEAIRKNIGPAHDMMVVIKANAYGAGAVEMAHFLTEEQGIKNLACAQIFEGVELRKAGIKEEILILGGAPDHAIPYGVEYDLQLALFNERGARIINECAKAQGKIAKCHIKIETGMNRIGVRPGVPLANLIDCVKQLNNIEIIGAFTHFATAGKVQNDFTLEQHGIFEQGVEQIQQAGLELQYIHCCNSSSTQWLKQGRHTHVRVGSLYMGYSDMDDGSNPFGVKPCLTWRAFVTNIHTLNKGESCGYSRYFMAEKPTKIATVDFGYADGFFKPMLMQGGPLYINETRTRYLGTCMDQTFIDVDGIDCNIGDEITIMGYTKGGQYLSPYEFEKYGQGYITYLCSANHRVKRVYTRQK